MYSELSCLTYPLHPVGMVTRLPCQGLTPMLYTKREQVSYLSNRSSSIINGGVAQSGHEWERRTLFRNRYRVAVLITTSRNEYFRKVKERGLYKGRHVECDSIRGPGYEAKRT